MRWMAAVALMAAVACGSATTASLPAAQRSGQTPTASAAAAPPTPTRLQQPSPAPSPLGPPVTRWAVLVDLFSGGSAYNIALVGADGRVVARATAQQRSTISDAAELPYVSASNTRVYYLDGDRQVRWLKPDGTTGLGGTVQGGPLVHATFAVTPDDSRIAVGLLDYSVSPVLLTLYVEDMGGAHHSVIYTSTVKYLWPVAWHAGQLVVAYIGPGSVPFRSKMVFYGGGDAAHPYGPNPYGGINFHVINPVTAQREVIISGGGASGLLTPAGTAVVQGDGVDWKGGFMLWNSPNDYGSYSASGSMSPDGKVIAACCPHPDGPGQLVLWYPDGSNRVLAVSVTPTDWVGWLDNSHLVTGFYQSSDGTPNVVDLNSNMTTPVDAHGIVAAILPGSLDG